METIFLKPRLYDLSQGSRIAFVRQFRTMSRKDISNKLKLKGDNIKKTFWRYEKCHRSPTPERLKELADILDVTIDSIKIYSLDSTNDLIYQMLWMEEIYPDFKIQLGKSERGVYYDQNAIDIFLSEWNDTKQKLKKGKINYFEYLEWKLNYKINNAII